MRNLLFVLTGLAVGLTVALALSSARSEPIAVETVLDPDVNVHERRFEVDGRNGLIVQGILNQQPHTTGPSPDVIRVMWEDPVAILGAAISVDIGAPFQLVEVAMGKGWDNYATNEQGALLHTSYAQGRPGEIDEQIWFGNRGMPVAPGEWVAVAAWLYNGTSEEWGVSPEVIIWYEPAA